MLPLLLLLFMTLTGCRWAKDALPLTDPATYLIFEGPNLKRVHRLTIRYHDPLRDLGFDSSSTYLLEDVPDLTKKSELNRIIRSTRRPRILKGQGLADADLLNVADWVASDQPNDHPRWIVGNLPVVVAVAGKAEEKPKGWGAAPVMDLVDADDMEKKVAKLIVLHDWPKGDFKEGERILNPWVQPPPEGRRVIELDPPQTLREVYAAPPWLPPVARGGVGEPDGAASAVRSAK